MTTDDEATVGYLRRLLADVAAERRAETAHHEQLLSDLTESGQRLEQLAADVRSVSAAIDRLTSTVAVPLRSGRLTAVKDQAEQDMVGVYPIVGIDA